MHLILRNKHRPISELSIFQFFHRLLDTLDIQRERLDYWTDLMEGSEPQHFAVDIPGGYQHPLNTKSFSNYGQVWDRDVAARDAQRENCTAGGQSGEIQFPIWLSAGCYYQVINGFDIQLIDTFHCHKLFRSKLLRLFLFGIGPGKHNDFTSHLRCKLYGEVSKPTHSYHTYAVCSLHAITMQSIEHCSTPTHERCCVCRFDFLWNLVEESFFPDCMCREGALVEVAVTVYASLRTEYLLTRPALFTATARVVLVPPACTVAYFETFDVFADFLDDTNTFMAKNDILVSMMYVCPAKSRVGNLYQYFFGSKIVFVGYGFDDFALFRAFIDGKVNTHLLG